MEDELGAFCRHAEVSIEGAPGGPLAGLRFAAKDIFDVAGHTCCCGNPQWLASHAPAGATAPVIEALLAAGATLVGKTLTDELAYSLNGENAHYGTPLNVAAPGRIPGGSSCGSVAAVAGGLVDFALGSDTGGSVRIPASYCGLYGLRPSHGRIAIDHTMALAPSFDTVGWFAREALLFARVGSVLLGQDPAPPPARLLLAEDAFAGLEPELRAALEPGLERITRALGEAVAVRVAGDDFAAWETCFRALMAPEVWAVHGDSVRRTEPDFGPGVADRFALARTMAEDEVAPHKALRERIARHMDELLGAAGVLCLPAAPGIAPLKETPQDQLEGFRSRILQLTSIAGLAGLPQASLPLAEFEGCPIGLSLIAPRGADAALLGAVLAVARAEG
ncbi:MAG: amidase [Proteobacteria bacterium]|nr:amidase [Pseudomonadota bacterium]